jgi:hypothetical protein
MKFFAEYLPPLNLNLCSGHKFKWTLVTAPSGACRTKEQLSDFQTWYFRHERHPIIHSEKYIGRFVMTSMMHLLESWSRDSRVVEQQAVWATIVIQLYLLLYRRQFPWVTSSVLRSNSFIFSRACDRISVPQLPNFLEFYFSAESLIQHVVKVHIGDRVIKNKVKYYRRDSRGW